MTKEELLVLIAGAKTFSSSAWAGAVSTEQAHGPLKTLTDNQDTSNDLYTIAQDYINRQTPNITYARVQLEGAAFLEMQRGGSAYAAAALADLTTYEGAPYYGTATAATWATAVNISTP